MEAIGQSSQRQPPHRHLFFPLDQLSRLRDQPIRRNQEKIDPGKQIQADQKGQLNILRGRYPQFQVYGFEESAKDIKLSQESGMPAVGKIDKRTGLKSLQFL